MDVSSKLEISSVRVGASPVRIENFCQIYTWCRTATSMEKERGAFHRIKCV